MADLSSGVLLVDIDGTICEFEGSFTVQPNSESREPKISHSGKVGIKRTPIAPGFKGTIQVYSSVGGGWYDSIVEKGCTVITRGRRYSYTGCTSSGTWEHELDEGTVSVEFFAQACEEDIE